MCNVSVLKATIENKTQRFIGQLRRLSASSNSKADKCIEQKKVQDVTVNRDNKRIVSCC